MGEAGTYRALSMPEQVSLQKRNKELEAKAARLTEALENIAQEGPDASAFDLIGFAIEALYADDGALEVISNIYENPELPEVNNE